MKRILIVEPELHGHKAFYLSLIVTAFQEAEITLLTDPDHPALHEHFERRGVDLDSIEVISIRSRKTASVFQQAGELTQTDNYDFVFITYLDSYLEHIFAEPDALACPVQGIWFHPYALDRHYRWIPPIDKRSRLRGGIHRSLRNKERSKGLSHIFFLDPDAPAALKRINPDIRSTPLIDPGERVPRLSKTDARAHFGLPQDRTIYLHAGSPEKRKGLPDVLHTFKKLIENPDEQKRIFLLRVGPNERLKPKEQAILQQLIESDCAHATGEFVPSNDFMEYYAAADWILIPYRNFRFSSGILANAVMARRPVIASDYGMIGVLTRKHSLGVPYRHRSLAGLKCALTDTNIPEVDSAPDSKATFVYTLQAPLQEDC